jgi:hypothetical protein
MTQTREQQNEYMRRWRKANPEKVREQSQQRREYMREYQRAWRARNPEKTRQIARKSKDLNRDETNARKRAWRAANPGDAREKDRAQRAKNPGRNQHGRWIKEDRAAMWKAQNGDCYLCGEPMDNPRLIRIDHDHSCCPPNTSCRTCRRGLAHHRCNIAIGYAGDDAALLRRMADALEAAQSAFRQRKAATGTGEQFALFD